MFDMSQEFGEILLHNLLLHVLCYCSKEEKMDSYIYKFQNDYFGMHNYIWQNLHHHYYTRDFHWECSRIVRQYNLEVTQDLAPAI